MGNYKLSRVRANELNIYCRGGVSGVKAHISQLRLSQQAKKDILTRDIKKYNSSRQTLVESVLSNNKSSLPFLTKPTDTVVSADQNYKPPIDFELLADWFNQNAYSIINVNHLKMRKPNSVLRGRYGHTSSKFSTYNMPQGGTSEANSRLSNRSPVMHYMTSQLSTKHGYG